MRLNFVFYLSRSGSTIITNSISEVKGMYVLPELDPLDYLINNYEWIRVKDKEKFKSIFLQDIKTQELKEINSIVLNNFISDLSLKEFIYLYIELFTNYYKIKNVNDVFLKSYSFKNVKKIREIFNDSHFVYIHRDPRAILNSQLKYKKISGEPFVSSTIEFCLLYKLFVKKFLSEKDEKNIHYIKYEDFISKRDLVLNNFLQAMDVKKIFTTSNMITPENQNYLHLNLKKENIPLRINAYMKELSKHDIRLVSKWCKNEIKMLNYLDNNVNCENLRFFMYLSREILKSMGNVKRILFLIISNYESK